MDEINYSRCSALKHLQSQIEEAWVKVRRERANEANGLQSFTEGAPIYVAISEDSHGDAFACQPSLGIITMKWWALEVLWLTTYVFHCLGSRLLRIAENGNREVWLEEDAELLRGRDALAHAAKLLEQRNSEEWPWQVPHPADEDPHVKKVNDVFFVALAWIELHEVAHIIVDPSKFKGKDIEEECYCDDYATKWILGRGGSLSTLRKEGVAVATFFLVLREALLGRGGKTHPSSEQRVLAAKISPRQGCRLAIVVDALLQSNNNMTPAIYGKAYSRRDYLVEVFNALYKALPV